VSLRLIFMAGLFLAACAPASDVSRSVGARCDGTDDCDQRCLSGADYPGGFCTLDCDDDTDCPDDTVCVVDEGNVCLFPCAENPDCQFLGAGWQCLDRPPANGGDPIRVCLGN